MATNSSEHLGLHLWEPTDQVLRTEFNQNWQKIDTAVAAAFGPDNKPYVSGSFTVGSDAESGDVVLTLDFTPHHVLLTEGSTIAIRQGGAEMLYTMPGTASSGSRYVTLQLSGKQVLFLARGSGISGSVTVSYVAYR